MNSCGILAHSRRHSRWLKLIKYLSWLVCSRSDSLSVPNAGRQVFLRSSWWLEAVRGQEALTCPTQIAMILLRASGRRWPSTPSSPSRSMECAPCATTSSSQVSSPSEAHPGGVFQKSPGLILSSGYCPSVLSGMYLHSTAKVSGVNSRSASVAVTWPW